MTVLRYLALALIAAMLLGGATSCPRPPPSPPPKPATIPAPAEPQPPPVERPTPPGDENAVPES